MHQPIVRRVIVAATFSFTRLAQPAAADEVTADPTASGLPGANLAQDLVNWTAQIALWGSLLSILIGAATWGLSHQTGHSFAVGRGRTLLLGGIVGALLTGLGPTIVNELFRSAQS